SRSKLPCNRSHRATTPAARGTKRVTKKGSRSTGGATCLFDGRARLRWTNQPRRANQARPRGGAKSGTKKGAHPASMRAFFSPAALRGRGGGIRLRGLRRVRSVREEDGFDLVLDLFLGLIAGNRDLLDDEATRRVEHPALAEGQLLVGLE